MKTYCPVEQAEREFGTKDAETMVCRSCGASLWADDYPIGENEVPNGPLVAARQKYQRERDAYYARKNGGR